MSQYYSSPFQYSYSIDIYSHDNDNCEHHEQKTHNNHTKEKTHKMEMGDDMNPQSDPSGKD